MASFLPPDSVPSSLRISIEERVAQLIHRKRTYRSKTTTRAFDATESKKTKKRCLKCQMVLSYYERRDGDRLCGSCNLENSRLGIHGHRLPPSAMNQDPRTRMVAKTPKTE